MTMRARALLTSLSHPTLLHTQACGVNAIVYFTPTLLREAGAPALFARFGAGPDVASMLATVLAYLPKIPSVLLASYLIDRAGRRQLLLWMTPLMAGCLAALAAALGGGFAGAGFVATMSVMLFGVVFGMSLGPLPNILASELFPTSSRSLGVSLSTASQWSFNALIAATFPALRLRFGARNVLNGFAMISLLSWAFTYYFVPETKGKALEDIGATKGE